MKLFRGLLTALSFLTRIPVPSGRWAPGPSVAFFPAVGLLLGAASAGAVWLLFDRLGLAPRPIWALTLVGLQALLTGALHLDGLSDVVDGLGGARGDRQRALEIMKDPRIGAFGVVALVFAIGAKILTMNELLHLPGRVPLLLAYPVGARLGAALLVVALPCARATGLAATFHSESRWHGLAAAALMTAGVLWCQHWATAIPTAASLGAGLVTGLYLAARLRGVTGDVYGAAIELGEIAFLIAATWGTIVRWA
jgi:adenosylcobinamide-GDP ribazoletransferase